MDFEDYGDRWGPVSKNIFILFESFHIYGVNAFYEISTILLPSDVIDISICQPYSFSIVILGIIFDSFLHFFWL